MKNIKYLSIFTVVVISLAFVGCNKNENSNSAANIANKAATNTNVNAGPDTADINTDSGTTGTLATPTDAYKTALSFAKRKISRA